MSYSSFATHIIGGELTYRCVGENVYELTLSVYTECGSQAILEQSYPIQYYASALGISPDSPLTFNVNKISTNEIQLLCTSAVTDCNGGAARGVEVVLYKGKVDLSSFETTKDWRFFWQRAARSEGISTLVLPEEEDFFVEASLNNLDVSCNSSAIFQNLALATVCINQEYVFNNAATDPNGDVLKYLLITPKSSHDTEVVFSGDFSAENFLSLSTPAQLDEDTGDLSFTSDLLAIGITDFKVEEYRNGVLVGWVRRGIQFTTIDCSNKLPELSAFKETSTFSASACSGNNIDFTLEASDEDGDNLTMRLLSGRSDLFSITNNNRANPTAKISLGTSTLVAGEYQFVVSITDNVCPNPGVETKTYTITVRDNVTFNLGPDIKMGCSETITLGPEVAGGDGNYTYLWSDATTEASLEVGLGSYSLTVTDGAGCSFTDDIFITGEFVPAFVTNGSLCSVQTIEFTDTTPDVSATKDIVKWSWDFGDGNTSTDQNPTHTYAVAGEYAVTLVVTDNSTPECDYPITHIVTICDFPNFDFVTAGYCNYDPIDIIINTAGSGSCNLLSTVTFDFGDASGLVSCTDCFGITHIYQDAGIYTITIIGINENGCELTISKDFEIFASPEVNITTDNYILVCSSPVSLIETEIVQGGLAPITYQWNGEGTAADTTINSAGTYLVTATDDRGCDFTDVLTVTYPLAADFRYTPVCDNIGDVVSFTDFSTDLTNTITDWMWDFGDVGSGVDNASTLQNPQHSFSAEGSYTVTLRVEDDDGCADDILAKVYNEIIDPTYTTLQYTQKEICLQDIFTGIGPTGGNATKYLWDFGDGSVATSKDVSHFYQAVGEYEVSLTVSYNQHSMADPQGCVKTFEDEIRILAWPEVEIVSTPERYCLNEEITFSFIGGNIQEVLWTFTNLTTGEEDTDNQLSTKYSFSQRTRYKIELTAMDHSGCSVVQSYTEFVDDIVVPDFVSEPDICAKEYITFTETYKDIYENVTDYRWDFGDGQIEEGQVPIPLTTHLYQEGGDFTVTLTVFNSFSGCENSITKMIYLLRPPQIDFSYDTICARNTMTFVNKTTKGDGDIESYRWVFPDESTLDVENSTFYFEEGGMYPVSLISTSTLGCTDTLTQEVYVKRTPNAAIELSTPFIEAFIPTQFFDKTEDDDIVSYYWDFGDGNSSTEKDPTHTYQEIERYRLAHAVTNSLNCTDTTALLLDLNVYVELPNAFTPNNDGNNDYLRLIHQGVETLFEFKVYSRQGKLVFDAGSDINAQWDGLFHERPQATGVYVAQIKAIGAYGNEFNFKKNITLLR